MKGIILAGLKIRVMEEIAYHKGYMDKKQLMKIAEPFRKNGNGNI